jgi:Tol biopolymer transport system component
VLPADPHWGLRVVNVADGSFEDMDGGTYAFRPAWDPVQAWRVVSDGGYGLLEVDVNRAEHQLKLTENMYDGSPTFSPDGRYLALSAGTPGSGGYDIYRLNSNGSGRIQLTKTPLWAAVTPEGEGQQWNNVSPAWSPDGTQIAFLTDRSGHWEIWVMNGDGSNQRPMFSDEINARFNLAYDFVDERAISWR